MKKVLLLILCATVCMAGFAQKKKKKGAEEPVAPVVEKMTDEECLESIAD